MDFRHSAEIGTLYAIMLASPTGARPTGKNRPMKTPHITDSQPVTQSRGTFTGAAVSLALIVAFGLSNYLQQDSDSRHATTEHSNRPTVISAYLA
jgi:hypothetical protein